MFNDFFVGLIQKDMLPHGFCIHWSSNLLLTSVISDGIIFLAYFSIPFSLIYYVRRREDAVLNPVLWLFAAFIFACGSTHFLDIILLWQPCYWLAAIVKAITAVISIATAIYLWPRIPEFLNRPNTEELIRLNEQLSTEIEQRKKIELSLQNSEQRWKFALESGCDGVWDWNLATGEIFLSRRCIEILGFSDQDTENHYRDWESTIHPDDKQQMLVELQAHLDNKSVHFHNEHRIINADSQWRWILTQGLVVSRDEQGKPLRMIGTQTDITQAKEMQWQLIAKIIDGSPEAMLVVAEDGIIKKANNQAANIFAMPIPALQGYLVDDLVPKHCRSFHPQQRQKFMAESQPRAMRAKGTLTALRQDGSEFPVEISLTPIAIDNRPAVIVSIQDITERKRYENEMKLMAMIYQAIGEAVMMADSKNRIIAVNEAFSHLSGYAADEVIGKSTNILKSGQHGPDFYQAMWHSLTLTGHWQGEIWNKRKNGEIFHEWLVINTIYNNDGEPERRVAMFSEITELKQVEQTIWRQANFDPLTDLANRRMFQDRLNQEIKKTHRDQTSLAVMLLDLDQFKEVNDTLGHGMGDILLQETSKRIQRCVREVDTVARLGGDEFTVILGELDANINADRVAQALLQALSEPYHLGNELAYISVSIGITFYPQDAQTAEQLIKNADQAMYSAKQQGRNRYSYFTAEMEQSAQKRMHLINDLRHALINQEFVMYYQPIIELSTGKTTKAEALIRWHHPTRGLITPTEFIAVAEETGLIIEIGDWVFRTVCQQTAHWRTHFQADFIVSVNVSPLQFKRNLNSKDLFSYITDLGLPGNSIVVEITESLLLDANITVKNRLYAYRDAGIQVAIDDFGTGYSSLSYLKMFDIDFLKIDQSFTSGLAADSSDLALCEAIIVMAHKLDLKVIAEGVETLDQLDLLKTAGCDYAQGYLFSTPVTVEMFESLVFIK